MNERELEERLRKAEVAVAALTRGFEKMNEHVERLRSVLEAVGRLVIRQEGITPPGEGNPGDVN